MRKHLLFLCAACIAAVTSFAQSPTISSFSPASGPVGTLVTITGTNLSTPTAFTIGGVAAIVVSDDGTTLVGMVMPGAVTGSVSVMTSGGSASGVSNFTVTSTPYPTGQQGGKLVGTGFLGTFSSQGTSVSLSGDGNTAIVGGDLDHGGIGAAWIYTRSSGLWTQQGAKLVGSGVIGNNEQGISVAIAADGNTAIVGGVNDLSYNSYIWVWIRSGTAWSQQADMQIGTSSQSSAEAISVSMSADGNTAAVGTPGDSSSIGAVWVYTRSSGIWTQQGPKLVGTGYVDTGSMQGNSIALSADGNTIISGGPVDSNWTGAAWIFARSGGVWSQQGAKLIGTGAIGAAAQGSSVSLSADGNTAMVGGVSDNSDTGATWVYTRSGGIWTQQGPKLVGSGCAGTYILQGSSVSLSADGNTAVIGGLNDNFGMGAAWVFVRAGGTWAQQGNKLAGTGGTPGAIDQGKSLALSADGSTAIVGGDGDNNSIGAAWVFSSTCILDTSYDTVSICANNLPYTWDGIIFDSAGTQTAYLTTGAGCDSIAILTLTVHPLPNVSLNWGSLLANNSLNIWGGSGSGDTIWGEWCNPFIFPMSGGIPMGGTYSGEYVENDSFNIPPNWYSSTISVDTITYTYIDSNGCINSAVDTFQLQICEGIQNVSATNSISLYPNPNKGSFTLETSNAIGCEYTISDMLGNIVAHDVIDANEQSIELKDACEGVYTLVVKGAQPVRFVIVR